MVEHAAQVSRGGKWLDWIERAGNRLPHPMTLFLIGAVAVLVLSQVAASSGWSVERAVSEKVMVDGVEELVESTVAVKARGLLSGDDAYWAIDNIVENFTGFAPLGVVLVGMLGIGVAERAGAIGALLKVCMLITPQKLLTPAMIFLGILSSMALDAGYVVLLLIGLLVNPYGVLPYDGPMHGADGPFPRWVKAIVPLLFFLFLLPGLAYGIAAWSIRKDKDVAEMMGKTMADMGPYIVLAFFAAQFVAFFKQSNLGEMMALAGGGYLAQMDLPPGLLLAAFILLVMVANMFIGSASAKYAFFAPVFVPMFMAGGGISPEPTQAAYRVGDSCSNIITPLNPYMVIILVFMQKYVPKGGIGTLVALMLPYALVFAVVWTLLLLGWMATGTELGPQGPLWYSE